MYTRIARAVGTLLGAAVLTQWVGTAAAHVDYVVDGGEGPSTGELLAAVASDPVAIAAMAGGALIVAVAAAVYLSAKPLAADVAAFRHAMDEYRHLVPWLVRISVGFPLVGAGFAGYLFSPAVDVQLRIPQVVLGFLILFGLATRVAALVGLLAYLGALVRYPDLLLALEFVPGLLAVALIGPGSPSADEVLARVASAEGTVYGGIDPVTDLTGVLNDRLARYEPHLPTVLRAGLGASFLYLGITQKLLEPGPALAVVAKYHLTSVVPVSPELWVVGAGLAEAAVGVVILLGLFTRASCLVAFGLFATTLFGLPDDPVVAHLALFGLVSALLITGSGPLSVDRLVAERVGTAGDEKRHEPPAEGSPAGTGD
ncbi:DoxX family protein [Halobacteriales archaeon QS_8_69_26]|nr:MAG: DoxX family protein [Halobacteriales archaeon QS_8_69_26]